MTNARLQPALERSAAEWSLLRARLRTITPRAAARGLVSTIVALAAVWAAVSTWPALLPFAIGGVVAYAVFPLVDRLDRFMPRLLAAALATGVAVALVVGLVAVIVPPLVQQAIAIVTNLPGSSDLTAIRAQVDAYLATLPDTTRQLVQGVLDRVAAQLSSNLSGLLDGLAQFLVTSALHLFDTVGAVLGLVLMPIWVLYVVRDGKGISRLLADQFSPSVKPDVLAVIRIVHRAVSTFLRVQLSAALLVGAGVWAGLAVLHRLDPTLVARGELAAAAFAGVVQLIPQVGWLLGLLPAGIALAAHPSTPILPAAYVAIYLVMVRLVGLVVGQRLGRDLNVRAALAVPGVVIISTFGLLPLLLSAPIMVIARDLLAYARGRLGEPPLPAGVLPGEAAARRPPTSLRVPASPAALALYASAPPAVPASRAIPVRPTPPRSVRPPVAPAASASSAPAPGTLPAGASSFAPTTTRGAR